MVSITDYAVRRIAILPVILALATGAFSHTHVFWYKATEHGYNLQASPGPDLPVGATVHEGIIMSAAVPQQSGYATDGFSMGSGLDDKQGRCAVIWSKALCEHYYGAEWGQTCNFALVRGEFRDAWSGNGFCNAGPIAIRCGVVDFSGNLSIWGGPDLVSETATWQDFLNPLGSTMGYDMMQPEMEAEETINWTAPAGRPGESEPSVLDGHFAAIDITNQVKWILSHIGPNQGRYSGQYAIAFLVTPGMGSTGKINLYADEAASGSQISWGSNAPWTADGNTMHIIVSDEQKPTLSVTRYTPASDTSVALGDSLHLLPSIAASLGSQFLQQWYLEDQYVGTGNDYLFRTETLPLGTYSVKVRVWSGFGFAETEWKISVIAPAMEKAGGNCAVFNVAPNPFRTSARISFSTFGKALATITVHDIRGRGVATLAQGEYDKGVHEVLFSGQNLPAGVYVCRLTVGKKTFARKMLLM